MGAVKRLMDPNAAVLDLYSAELQESHRLLDTAGIPQSGYEEQLSISQRVAIAVELLKALKKSTLG